MNPERCIVQIGDYIVSSEIVTEFFACDYDVCRGACCVIGDGGAPLEEWEPERIERNYGEFSPLMTEGGRRAVERSGFFEIDVAGAMVTPLVAAGDSAAAKAGFFPAPSVSAFPTAAPAASSVASPASFSAASPSAAAAVGGTAFSPAGQRECAYASFDAGGRCFCTIERRWCAGRGDFRKPVSCSLYPIRVSSLGSGMTALNLHRWEICAAAYEKGRRDNVRVYEFLKEPILQRFGAELYTALTQCAQYLL